MAPMMNEKMAAMCIGRVRAGAASTTRRDSRIRPRGRLGEILSASAHGAIASGAARRGARSIAASTGSPMRASLLVTLLVAVAALQGCMTAIAAGTVADLNRQRRTAARTTGTEAPTVPPAPGDVLTLTLADGTQTTSTFAAFRTDSLVLDDDRTFALTDVARVERSWKRARGTPLLFGVAADLALVWLTLQYGKFN